jgi:uncharacterized protein (DUF486 family)
VAGGGISLEITHEIYVCSIFGSFHELFISSREFLRDGGEDLTEMKTILLLVISNTFMNLAWYGHLKFKNEALWVVILASWGLALFEYIFQVPANRIGSEQWTVPQLKILQECITLVVFTVLAFALFRSPLKWNYCISYGFILGAVFFAFKF